VLGGGGGFPAFRAAPPRARHVLIRALCTAATRISASDSPPRIALLSLSLSLSPALTRVTRPTTSTSRHQSFDLAARGVIYRVPMDRPSRRQRRGHASGPGPSAATSMKRVVCIVQYLYSPRGQLYSKCGGICRLST
jgi:hypothetical protein